MLILLVNAKKSFFSFSRCTCSVKPKLFRSLAIFVMYAFPFAG